MKPNRSALDSLLRRCGIALKDHQLDQLWEYHQFLREANLRLNLTRIHNFENMVLKHYADSLLVLKFLALPSPLIDMGSGPGLPGIPLKIASPQTQFVLAEPRGARADFLREVIERLGLEGVEVYPHKVGPDYPGKVAGVICRALGSMSSTLPRVSRCLRPGGMMIFMKGPGCDQEIMEASASYAEEFQHVADHHYCIPGTTHRRRLVIFARTESETGNARIGAELGPAKMPNEHLISSDSNPVFRSFRELLCSRGIRKQQRALISGPRVVAEVVRSASELVLAWITGPDGPPPEDKQTPWYRLARPLFEQLDVAGTHAPLLVVRACVPKPWSDDQPWPEGCTLFVPFQDPENVGAVLRSAAAFGVPRVVLLREAANPFLPKSSRAAGSALFRLPLLQGPSIHELSSRNAPLIALDASGPDLLTHHFPPTFGLVAGIEGPGLPETLRQGERRSIPMESGVESLNAATATAIALFVWSTERPDRKTTVKLQEAGVLSPLEPNAATPEE